MSRSGAVKLASRLARLEKIKSEAQGAMARRDAVSKLAASREKDSLDSEKQKRAKQIAEARQGQIDNAGTGVLGGDEARIIASQGVSRFNSSIPKITPPKRGLHSSSHSYQSPYGTPPTKEPGSDYRVEYDKVLQQPIFYRNDSQNPATKAVSAAISAVSTVLFGKAQRTESTSLDPENLIDQVRLGNISTVRDILRRPDISHYINELDPESGNAALHEATLNGNEEILELLLQSPYILKGLKNRKGFTYSDIAKQLSDVKDNMSFGTDDLTMAGGDPTYPVEMGSKTESLVNEVKKPGRNKSGKMVAGIAPDLMLPGVGKVIDAMKKGGENEDRPVGLGDLENVLKRAHRYPAAVGSPPKRDLSSSSHGSVDADQESSDKKGIWPDKSGEELRKLESVLENSENAVRKHGAGRNVPASSPKGRGADPLSASNQDKSMGG